jgi:hypothetical protein
MTGQDLLKHMGAHILNDPRLRGAASPCGLCLNAGPLCEIFLIQRNGVISIDQVKSHCPNIRTLHISKASEFTPKQPCTNHPLICPLCPRGASAVWKYNLQSHILAKHPLSNVTLYESYWGLHHSEEPLMKIEWEKLKRYRTRPSKDTATRKLKISEGHSSRLMLRYLFASPNLIYI